MLLLCFNRACVVISSSSCPQKISCKGSPFLPPPTYSKNIFLWYRTMIFFLFLFLFFIFYYYYFFMWQNICHFALRKKLPSNLHSQGNFWKKNSKRNQLSKESYLIAKIFLGGFGHIIAI
jgi:hypothetical protein